MHGFHFGQMASSAPCPSPYFVKYHDYDEVLLKNILSLTLTLGCNNEKWPSGPIELDLEAGNLVFVEAQKNYLKLPENLKTECDP